jgi:hypothetical protein
VLHFLGGQPGELLAPRVAGGEESLFTVENGRIGSLGVIVAVVRGICLPLDADDIPTTLALEAAKVEPIKADPADPDEVGRAVRKYQTLSLKSEGLAKNSFSRGMAQVGMAVAFAREAGVVLLVMEVSLGEEYPRWCKKAGIDYTWQNRAKGYAKYLKAEERLIGVHKANALVSERRRLEYVAAATPSSHPPEATAEGTPEATPEGKGQATSSDQPEGKPPEGKAPAKSSGKSKGGKATSGPKLTKTGGIATGRRGRPVNANPTPKRLAKGMKLIGEAIKGGEVKDRQILQTLAWLANRLSDERVQTWNPEDVAEQDELKGNLDKVFLAVLDYQRHLAPTWALEGAAEMVKRARVSIKARMSPPPEPEMWKGVAAYVKEVRGQLDAIGKLLPPRK